jgi:hypothetical protein
MKSNEIPTNTNMDLSLLVTGKKNKCEENREFWQSNDYTRHPALKEDFRSPQKKH